MSSLHAGGGPDEAADDDEAPPRFLMVHSRPFLLTYEPDALLPWGLAITTSRMPSLDGTHEVVGQVRAAI
jgi:hypothetical protein